MVLVAERTEQARQGDTRVPPAKDDGRTPDMGFWQKNLCLKVRIPDMVVRRSLNPVGTQNRWGPKDLTWWTGASRTRWPRTREFNLAADDLSTRASTWASVPEGVFERRLLRPTASLPNWVKGIKLAPRS